MNTYKVTLVFDDSSTTSNLVNATGNESALNTLLNNRMITQQPKFVIFEDVEYTQKEGDFELVRNFKRLIWSMVDQFTYLKIGCLILFVLMELVITWGLFWVLKTIYKEL